MADVDMKALQQELMELRIKLGMEDKDLDIPKAPRFSPQEARELAKFEQFPSEITALAGKPPGNPWVFRPYPRMLYQAQRHPVNGKWVLFIDMPKRYDYPTENQWDMACEQARQFAAACQKIVHSEREHQAARDDGWRDSAKEALEFREQELIKRGDEAAERNYRDRNMSEKALAEVEKAESAHFGHLPEIPETPLPPRTKRKYTRRAKPEQTPAA